MSLFRWGTSRQASLHLLLVYDQGLLATPRQSVASTGSLSQHVIQGGGFFFFFFSVWPLFLPLLIPSSADCTEPANLFRILVDKKIFSPLEVPLIHNVQATVFLKTCFQFHHFHHEAIQSVKIVVNKLTLLSSFLPTFWSSVVLLMRASCLYSILQRWRRFLQ